jgi:hypothetical protein
MMLVSFYFLQLRCKKNSPSNKKEETMLDFKPVRAKQMTLNELAAPLSLADLRRLTEEMLDREQTLIAECTDADVTFPAFDPAANDTFAANPEDIKLSWNLGHVIVHATASSEESAFLAAELARGVPFHGRSRSEVPWQEVTTIAQCRQRLAESRRMRLASLDLWPELPHLDNLAEMYPGAAPVDAKGRFIMGLMHDDSHLAQIAEIVRQAHAAS